MADCLVCGHAREEHKGGRGACVICHSRSGHGDFEYCRRYRKAPEPEELIYPDPGTDFIALQALDRDTYVVWTNAGPRSYWPRAWGLLAYRRQWEVTGRAPCQRGEEDFAFVLRLGDGRLEPAPGEHDLRFMVLLVSYLLSRDVGCAYTGEPDTDAAITQANLDALTADYQALCDAYGAGRSAAYTAIDQYPAHHASDGYDRETVAGLYLDNAIESLLEVGYGRDEIAAAEDYFDEVIREEGFL
ncbi:MAG: hypothetical protein JSV86_19895 [Gemmatimonadota bacterium]|nr:MAG: hypothetical protein JSV86_19895 [Gemmatimonadota bacterium]